MDHNNLQDIHEFSNMERKRNAFASKSNIGFHPQKNANPIYNYYADGQKYLDEPSANFDFLDKDNLTNSPSKSIQSQSIDAQAFGDFGFLYPMKGFSGNNNNMNNDMNSVNTNINNNSNQLLLSKQNERGMNMGLFGNNPAPVVNSNNNNNNTNQFAKFNQGSGNAFSHMQSTMNDHDGGIPGFPGFNMMNGNNMNNNNNNGNNMVDIFGNGNSNNNRMNVQRRNMGNNKGMIGGGGVGNNFFNGFNNNNNYNNKMNQQRFNNNQNQNAMFNMTNSNKNMNNLNFSSFFGNNNNNNPLLSMQNTFVNNPQNTNNAFGKNPMFPNTNPMKQPFNNQTQFPNNMNTNNNPNTFNNTNVMNFNPNQKAGFRREDYIFEKFGKRGWQCEHCNNFNFESK